MNAPCSCCRRTATPACLCARPRQGHNLVASLSGTPGHPNTHTSPACTACGFRPRVAQPKSRVPPTRRNPPSPPAPACPLPPQNYSADLLCSALAAAGLGPGEMLRVNDPRRPPFTVRCHSLFCTQRMTCQYSPCPSLGCPAPRAQVCATPPLPPTPPHTLPHTHRGLRRSAHRQRRTCCPSAHTARPAASLRCPRRKRWRRGGWSSPPVALQASSVLAWLGVGGVRRGRSGVHARRGPLLRQRGMLAVHGSR